MFRSFLEAQKRAAANGDAVAQTPHVQQQAAIPAIPIQQLPDEASLQSDVNDPPFLGSKTAFLKSDVSEALAQKRRRWFNDGEVCEVFFERSSDDPQPRTPMKAPGGVLDR